jgi:hypothetical protein
MPETRRLLSVELVTDCDTGLYEVGAIDFSVPTTTHDWLDDEERGRERRSNVAHFLHWMAVGIERGELFTFKKRNDEGSKAASQAIP